MKSPIALFAPVLLIIIAVFALIVAVADAGGHTTPGGTILDIGDCRSRYCPRNTLGMDTATTTTTPTTTTIIVRPRPLRTVKELFGFGGGRNYDDDEEEKKWKKCFIFGNWVLFLVLEQG